MGYLAYLIALIQTAMEDTSSMSFEQGVDLFLDKATGIHGTFFWISIAIWAVAIVFTYITRRRGESLAILSMGCGCAPLLFALPIIQYIVWSISSMMANAWGPEGATDPVKFWIGVALTVLFGAG